MHLMKLLCSEEKQVIASVFIHCDLTECYWLTLADANSFCKGIDVYSLPVLGVSILYTKMNKEFFHILMITIFSYRHCFH